MSALPQEQRTEEAYLEFERASVDRHEYLDGQVVAMIGASRAHNLIASSIHVLLFNHISDRPCELYQADMRVKVSATGLYTYPALVVVCGEPQFTDAEVDALLNPTLIIEVLSASTESYDRGKNFQHYRQIDSL